jgi:hypothetical protein
MPLFVQLLETDITFAPTNPYVTAFPSPNTAGNFIFVILELVSTSGPLSAVVTDTQGNTYTQIGVFEAYTAGCVVALFGAPNIKAGANTVSAAYTAGLAVNQGKIAIVEYSSVDTATPIASNAFAQGAGPQTVSLTTTTASQMILLIGAPNSGGGRALVPPAGFTARFATSDTHLNLMDGVIVTPATANYNFTLNPVDNADAYLTWGVVLKTGAPPATYSISGNAGIAGATVTLSGDTSEATTADGSGNYSFVGLPNGNYVVTPSLVGYTFTPTSRSETISGATITGVSFVAAAVSEEVYIAEVQITVFYQSAGNYLYARDVNSWGDGGAFGANNGTPYPACNVVIGSITLSQLGGPMFPLQHVCGYFDAVGTLNNGKASDPTVFILPNEVNDTKGIGFVQLPEVLPEPPVGQNHSSKTILARRWNVNMANSYLMSQFIHTLQLKISFEPENAPNTIKAVSFGENQQT